LDRVAAVGLGALDSGYRATVVLAAAQELLETEASGRLRHQRCRQEDREPQASDQVPSPIWGTMPPKIVPRG
jgi:hypothetical protein